MNYPLISEYIGAIKSAEDNFEELSYLRPVLGDDGLPIMSAGGFSVVFKMKNEQNGKFYAVKCFTKEQMGRAEAYREIAKELEKVFVPYLTSFRYLDKELFVDTDQTTETEFPVLLMDWVEGKTLDKYLRENLDDKYTLEMLAYRFSQLAQWLIPQPFAHGDLKPDNILVREDGTLVLVDYDGMYVPAMKGQKARELGSPDFRHPLRTEEDFNERIDDFPLVSILLSLKAVSIKSQLLEEFGVADRLILAEKDYLDICKSNILKELYPSSDSELNVLFGLFAIIFEKKDLYYDSSHLLNLSRPMSDEEADALVAWEDNLDFEADTIAAWEEEYDPYNPFEIVKTWPYQEFVEGVYNIIPGHAYYPITDDIENVYKYLRGFDEEDIVVYNLHNLTLEQINGLKEKLEVTLLTSGYYFLDFNTNYIGSQNFSIDTIVAENDMANAWIDKYGVKYSGNKKKLLEGPTEVIKKGTHTWKKGLLSDSYTIEQGTMFICEKAFFDCRGLISITFPSSIIAIGAHAFSGCSNLSYLHMNDSIQRIGDEAFRNCKYLHSISIPKSLTYIGENAFEGSGINTIFINFGDKKRVESLLPKYKDMIIEPLF